MDERTRQLDRGVAACRRNSWSSPCRTAPSKRSIRPGRNCWATAWTDLVGAKFVDFTHPGDLGSTAKAFAAILDAPITIPVENRLRHKGGAYRWFAWTGTFEDGKIYASGRDVTRDKEREAVLRDTQDFARLALSAVGWGRACGPTRSTATNSSTTRRSHGSTPSTRHAVRAGVPRAEFLGHVHPDDRAPLKATMEVGLKNPGDLELEYRPRPP